MTKIFLYSGLLVAGMALSQVINLDPWRGGITLITMTCLAYIMTQVGLEFHMDKRNLKQYGWDYAVAATAAAFPWIFCAVYFVFFFKMPWPEALLVGRFAAPTSAGILFAMLMAAGLTATWVFRKVQILAIFDDLDTILLMIPLKIMIVGWKPELAFIIFIIAALLWTAYRFLNSLRLPASNGWLFFYGLVITSLCYVIDRIAHLHIEVLLPAFAWGCMLKNPHHKEDSHLHQPHRPEPASSAYLDQGVKAFFMLLVGLSLPRMTLETMPLQDMVIHVTALTLLSNLGKCFPLFCYRKEASWKERLAVCIAMFPRGEVGAGVLLVAISYGLGGTAASLGGISLAVNLLLTGLFISAVLLLLKPSREKVLS